MRHFLVSLFAADLKARLELAIEAQESAAQQLLSERALRQAAEERADRYHAETLEALKSQTDWLARGLYHRRPVYGVGAPPDAPESTKPAEPIPTKPNARTVARDISNKTLADLWENIRSVGPEFTAS